MYLCLLRFAWTLKHYDLYLEYFSFLLEICTVQSFIPSSGRGKGVRDMSPYVYINPKVTLRNIMFVTEINPY
jgi:hypothetical protein